MRSITGTTIDAVMPELMALAIFIDRDYYEDGRGDGKA